MTKESDAGLVIQKQRGLHASRVQRRKNAAVMVRYPFHEVVNSLPSLPALLVILLNSHGLQYASFHCSYFLKLLVKHKIY